MLENFVRDAIIINGEKIEKEEGLELLVAQLCKAYHLPHQDAILERIIERESRLSTGIGLGIAVPHCKIADIDQVYLGVMLDRHGIEYNAADKSPVQLIFLIVSPEMDYESHIKCLSIISKAAADETTRARMLNAKSVDILFDILMAQM